MQKCKYTDCVHVLFTLLIWELKVRLLLGDFRQESNQVFTRWNLLTRIGSIRFFGNLVFIFGTTCCYLQDAFHWRGSKWRVSIAHPLSRSSVRGMENKEPKRRSNKGPSAIRERSTFGKKKSTDERKLRGWVTTGLFRIGRVVGCSVARRSRSVGDQQAAQAHQSLCAGWFVGRRDPALP